MFKKILNKTSHFGQQGHCLKLSIASVLDTLSKFLQNAKKVKRPFYYSCKRFRFFSKK